MLISAEAAEQYNTPNFINKFSLEIHSDKALIEWNARGNKHIATVTIVRMI